ncbi:MAG: ssDNA endonuclease and repair protein rad10 [Icmadophila ericetorum]|nr:ssDNA endonuclease and repair protein rad10 [Icmadophila ericetorum]
MDDDFDDADFAALADAVERNYTPQAASSPRPGLVSSASSPKVQQPKPQALPNRNAPSSILVSPRQKGNPILNNIRSQPWEYSDIPADYVLGATTCALFLSLKYHRLHPEYIYSRIRALQHKYNLRILLTMVDIQNHEESLKELSKTSMVNNLTLILCWSAAEAGHYLELYKSYEHANPTAIKAHQSTSYAEKLVEFITVPRSVNKTDAVALVSTFGSIRAAVNARPEEIGNITGWGEKKVQRWCGTVREPFRMKKAAKRGIERENTGAGSAAGEDSLFVDEEEAMDEDARLRVRDPIPIGRVPSVPSGEVSSLVQVRPSSRANATSDVDRRAPKRAAEDSYWEPGEDEVEALAQAAPEEILNERQAGSPAKLGPPHIEPLSSRPVPVLPKPFKEAELSSGIAAALAKLRDK